MPIITKIAAYFSICSQFALFSIYFHCNRLF